MHIGLILDGNRRWAHQRGLPKLVGHKTGIDNLEKMIKFCAAEPKVKFLTAFALSTENMSREKAELNNLFYLIERFAAKWKKFVDQNICVKPIGRFEELPSATSNALRNLQEKTAHCSGLTFIPAINYGGRDEILRAAKKLVAQNMENFSENDFEKFLDTASMPSLDIVIRTGGKQRLSNFLLWQSAYSELFFLDKMWPDFSAQDLRSIIEDFENIQRNFGK